MLQTWASGRARAAWSSPPPPPPLPLLPPWLPPPSLRRGVSTPGPWLWTPGPWLRRPCDTTFKRVPPTSAVRPRRRAATAAAVPSCCRRAAVPSRRRPAVRRSSSTRSRSRFHAHIMLACGEGRKGEREGGKVGGQTMFTEAEGKQVPCEVACGVGIV
eukprot:223817-Chlamydomonas_euryale.AAC.2